MPKIEALTDLLARVKAGNLHTQKYGGMPTVTAMYQHFGGFGAGVWSDARFMSAYHGSLDAAMALHEAVLPGWVVYRSQWWPTARNPSIYELWQTSENRSGEWCHSYPGNARAEASAEDPARAWLIAILEALIAMEKNDD